MKNDFGPAKLEYLFQKFTFDAQSFIAEIRTAMEAGAVDDVRSSASSAQTMSPNGLQHSNARTMRRQRSWRTASPSNARQAVTRIANRVRSVTAEARAAQ